MKKILVAVDGSKPSLIAARLGRDLATATGAKLTLAYAVPPILLPGEVPFTAVKEIVAADLERGQEILAAVAKELGGGVETLALQGPVAEVVADVAAKDGFDLVVVGSRGRNAVARVLLGSVADRLVHICSKPVLVAR